jgi:hypothetical protein
LVSYNKERTKTGSAEKRELRKILVYQMEEMVRVWRKLDSKKVHNLHSSPNIIGLNNLRLVRRASHVAYYKKHTSYFSRKTWRDDTTKMNNITELRHHMATRTGLIWHRIRTVVGSCDDGNELPCFVRSDLEVLSFDIAFRTRVIAMSV